MKLLCVLSIFLILGSFAAAAEYQLVGNSSVEEQELSQNDVRQILLINRTTWKNGTKIVLVTLSPEAKESEAISLDLMNMTALQTKKYWLTKVFNGVISAIPFTEESIQDVIDRVVKTRGAFAVLPPGSPTGSAKKIRLQ